MPEFLKAGSCECRSRSGPCVSCRFSWLQCELAGDAFMKKPLLVFAVIALVVGWIVPSSGEQNPGIATGSLAKAAGKESQATPKQTSWQCPKTPWGHPDLQGMWTNFDRTPFERPLAANAAPRRNTGAAGVGPSPDFSQ